MQKLLFLIPLICLGSNIACIDPPAEKVKWVSVNDIDALYAKEPRPILFDVYTTWCGWCKTMDKKTYSNEKLGSYLDTKFYAVKFDAESKSDVRFNGKLYSYDAKSGNNKLAEYLLNGQMEFPTTVILSAPGSMPDVMVGYMKPGEMEGPLKYYGEKANLTMSFDAFIAGMKAEW